MTELKKSKYPDLFRWAYANGQEKTILTPEERKSIPRQTISDWRKVSNKKKAQLEEAMDMTADLKQFLERQSLEQKTRARFFIQIARFQLRLVQQMGKKHYHKMISEDKKGFLELVHSLSEWMPFAQVLRLFQMNKETYRTWVSQCAYQCDSSLISLCAKRHPYQITQSEYAIIEKSLQDPFYAHWPKSAIHSHLLKRNVLTMSRSTFYKHARMIEPSSEKRVHHKPNYIPLRAEAVNEIWHMDISHFRTADGNKYYIYALIDNFSRKILAWNCLDYISQVEIGALIQKGLQDMTGISVQLVSDAGTENVNQYIQKLLHAFFEEYEAKFKHDIALRTIRQSNSMVERFFRIMKSQYLYYSIPTDYAELYGRLNSFFIEYNQVRPHYALRHQTPEECYLGNRHLKLEKRYGKARDKRYKLNKTCLCAVCTCG